MSPTRREFIKQFGVMLASLAMSGCAPWLRRQAPEPTPMVTCYLAEPPPTTLPAAQLTRQAEILTATAGSGSVDPEATRQALAAIARDRLRAAWQRFDELAARTQADYEASEIEIADLATEHRAALDDLVARGELSEAVADQVQVAFEAAAYHVWRSNAPITCYAPVLVDYKPGSSNQLVEQAELLAGREDLQPETVAQLQEAMAREIAFLTMPQAEVQALYDRLIAAQQGGQAFPAFENLDLDLSPDDLAAARFLLDLLLDRVS